MSSVRTTHLMEDLAHWLGQQVEEDARIARATVWDGSSNRLDWELIASATIDVGGDEFYVGDRTIANHMMAWEPARALREVEGKLGILRRYADVLQQVRTPASPENRQAARIEQGALEDVMRLLALAYTDRPGFHDAWRL